MGDDARSSQWIDAPSGDVSPGGAGCCRCAAPPGRFLAQCRGCRAFKMHHSVLPFRGRAAPCGVGMAVSGAGIEKLQRACTARRQIFLTVPECAGGVLPHAPEACRPDTVGGGQRDLYDFCCVVVPLEAAVPRGRLHADTLSFHGHRPAFFHAVFFFCVPSLWRHACAMAQACGEMASRHRSGHGPGPACGMHACAAPHGGRR